MRLTLLAPAALLLLATALAGAAEPILPAGPLTVQQCVDLALQRHPDIASAVAALRQARANVTISRSQLYPQVQLEWAARENQSLARPVTVGGQVIEGTAKRSTQRDADVNGSWTLYQSGTYQEIKQARAQAGAAEFGLEDVRQQLAYSVQQAYFDVLTTRQLARVNLKAMGNAQRHLDLVQARLDQGQVPESDLLPVKAEVARARLGSVQAETNLGIAEANLRALLVLPPAAALDLAGPLPAQPVRTELPALLAQATAQRPDVAEQQLLVRAAELRTRVAKIQAGVQLNAVASGDYGRHTGATGEEWAVRVGATYPLFDGGSSRAAVTVAESSQEQANQRLALLQLQVQQDVEAAYLRAKQAEAGVDAAVASREESARSLAAAEARYREGLAIIIEVTDAELQLQQAEVAELQARHEFALAQAELARATGAPVAPATGDAK